MGAVFFEGPGVHEMEFIEIVLNMGIHFFDDFSGHITQFDHPIGARDLVFVAISDDRLAKEHRISPFIDIFGVVISGTVMEI